MGIPWQVPESYITAVRAREGESNVTAFRRATVN